MRAGLKVARAVVLAVLVATAVIAVAVVLGHQAADRALACAQQAGRRD